MAQQAPANQVSAIHALRGPPAPQPHEPLEQRILDLLQPFRDCTTSEDTTEEECKALILCENIAFLIRHRHASASSNSIRSDDISLGVRNWSAQTKGTGPAGLGIFINGTNGYTYAVMRVLVQPDENVVEKLTKAMDETLQQFFPEI